MTNFTNFTDMDNEEFRKIKGFDKYYISNYGKVLSLSRKQPKLLKHIERSGRHSTIVLHANKTKTEKTIYKLIEEAFGTRSSKYKVKPIFKNGDIRDFRPQNISYEKKKFKPLPGDIIIKNDEQILTVAKKILANLNYGKYMYRDEIIFDIYTAEDLIMEIYMVVKEKENEYGGMSENFAFTIGKNLIFKMQKKSEYLYKLDRITDTTDMSYDNLEALVSDINVENEVINDVILQEKLDLLTSEEQEVVSLRINGFSLVEIAAELFVGVSKIADLERSAINKIRGNDK